MGSKKRDETSSSSSSDSDSSEEHSKIKRKSEKTKKRSSSWSEEDTKKHKSKRQEDSSPETRKRPKHQNDSDHEERSRKRRRSSSDEHKERSSNQRGRHHDHRSDDRDRRSHDRRQDDRDRKQDDRDHKSGDRHRPAQRHDERDRDRRGDRRDDRDRRDDGGRNYRDRNNRGGGGGFRRGNRDRDDNFDHASAKWGKDVENKGGGKKAPGEKQKPNFGLSGKLTEETNTFKGVVIKYSEPPEARKPKRRWRLYPFKGEKALQTLYIHRESAYLIGRDRKVVDLPVDHPSCSKQHAALQYRLVPFTRDDGSVGKRVRPYLIDLESSNGTFINNKQIESKKYVELLERDVIKFGFSSREYVLLHENSKDEAQDDDVKNEEELLPVKKEEPAE